jgi:LPS-assembly protein
MKRILYFFLLTLIIVLPAYAEEAKPAKEPIVCNGDKVEFLEKEQEVICSGHVVVTQKELKLTCDKARVFLATGDAIAEGDVLLYQENSILSAENFIFNFNTKKGHLVKAKIKSLPVFSGSKEADKLSENEITMEKGYATTCELYKPHYRIQSNKVKIYLNDKVVCYSNTFYLGDIPVFYLPRFTYSLKEEKKMRVTVVPGKSKDWGYYLLSAWRYDLGLLGDGRIRLDYREKKDFAVGLDNFHHVGAFGSFGQGMLRYYFMRERNIQSKSIFDEERNTWERTRYRVSERYKWDINEKTQLIAEYHKLSDSNFLKDYFYNDDYERGSTESYLSLVNSGQNHFLSLFFKKRVNKYESAIESLPELKADLRELRIGSSDFYLSSYNTMSNLKSRNAQSVNLDSDLFRADSNNRLSYSRKIGFIDATPYVGMRETFYRQNIFDEKNVLRSVFSSGVNLTTKFYRIFDIQGKFWGGEINKIRHMIQPSITYTYVRPPSVANENLPQFDGTDSITRESTLGLALENKLQTKRTEAVEIKDEATGKLQKISEYKSVDLASLILNINYKFKPKNIGGSRWTDLTADLEFNPLSWLTVEAGTTYSPRMRRFESMRADIYANGGEKWQFGYGYRYNRETYSESTFEISFMPHPKWKIGAYERFMWKGFPYGLKKTNNFREQEYRLTHDLHCWLAEVIYNIGKDEGETLWFVFRLKAFPEMPLEFEHGYHMPKPGTQQPMR